MFVIFDGVGHIRREHLTTMGTGGGPDFPFTGLPELGGDQFLLLISSERRSPRSGHVAIQTTGEIRLECETRGPVRLSVRPSVRDSLHIDRGSALSSAHSAATKVIRVSCRSIHIQ